MANTKKPILYLHVSRPVKSWIAQVSRQQKSKIGFGTMSHVVERILNAAKKDPNFIKAALGEK